MMLCFSPERLQASLKLIERNQDDGIPSHQDDFLSPDIRVRPLLHCVQGNKTGEEGRRPQDLIQIALGDGC